MNEDRDGGGDAATWGATHHADVPTGLRAIFGAPVEKPCQGEPETTAALDMRDEVRRLSQRGGFKEHLCIRIGIGINSGAVLTENSVSAQRLEDRVIDDTISI